MLAETILAEVPHYNGADLARLWRLPLLEPDSCEKVGIDNEALSYGKRVEC